MADVISTAAGAMVPGPLLPPTNEEVNAFARVRLSVYLLARLLKNACMDLDEMLRVD